MSAYVNERRVHGTDGATDVARPWPIYSQSLYAFRLKLAGIRREVGQRAVY